MKRYSLSHLADPTLLRDLAVLVTQDRVTTASMLAHLAEVDARRLYLGRAYPSLYMYCVRELRMSEDAAFKRIRTARAARRFPEIFPALAEGRLNLNTVVLLAPHLTEDNARELLVAAEHKGRAEIEQLVAERFPQPDLPPLITGFARVVPIDHAAPAPVEPAGLQPGPDPRVPGAEIDFRQLAARPVATMFGVPVQPSATTRVVPTCAQEMTGPSAVRLAPEPVLESRPRLAPLSPGRFALQVTVDQETHDLLRYAQALLGHSVPSGDLAQVQKRAVAALVRELEQQKFAKCARSRPSHSTPKGRHIPSEVRRLVWVRDNGRCTFVSDCGKRCESSTRLEFDHVEPVARGGQVSVAGIRLRCRAHNQYAAECTYGADFMRHKREEARGRAAQGRERARQRAQAREHEREGEEAQARGRAAARSHAHGRTAAAAESVPGSDVIPWLRALGFSAEEARRGAALCTDDPDARLDQRVRIALRGLAPNCVRRPAPVASRPSGCGR